MFSYAKPESKQKENSKSAVQKKEQVQARQNVTGIPDTMKIRYQNMSGFSFDDVRVHYNSDKPAQLQALAYTQGNQVYVAPRQEKHLGHEFGHVVQQKQGRVRPTAQLQGQHVNDNEALESEADKISEQYSQSDNINKAVPMATLQSGSEPDFNAPVQMAGHSGVMVFGNNRIFKRIEENEFNEFRRVYGLQRGTKGEDQQAEALAVFPFVYRVLDLAPEQAMGADGGYNQDKFNDWLSEDGVDDYYVEMESLSGADFSIKDLKVGTTTANAEELFRNGHKPDTASAETKGNKMTKIDKLTETKRYGFRDSDAMRSAGNLLKLFFGRMATTVDSIRKEIDTKGSYPHDSLLVQDLETIRDYFDTSDTLYIASSIIIKWSNDRNNRAAADRAKLIDLAHPVRLNTFMPRGVPAALATQAERDEAAHKLDSIRRGLVGGVDNIIQLVTNQQMNDLTMGTP